MLKELWHKIKNAIIKWLGGYTLEQYSYVVDKRSNEIIRRMEARHELDDMRCRIKTVTAELRILDGMSDDDAIRIGKDSICRQLGEAVYPYARHFVCNGRYTATVNVQTYKDGKS